MQPIYKTLTLTLLLSAPVAHGYEPAGTPPDWPSPVMIPPPQFKVMIDRLEGGWGDNDTNVWEAKGWYGGDVHRLAVATEGEGEQGETLESAELEVAYSRLFAPFWDWQVGIRQDFQPKPERTHFMLALQGMMPYRFETQAALYASDDGDVSARIEFEYDLKLTQRLVLQPRLELNTALHAVDDVGVGQGLNSTELGLRLRYEVRREFAPYIGVAWEKLYGDSEDLAAAEGEDGDNLQVVAGLRFWF